MEKGAVDGGEPPVAVAKDVETAQPEHSVDPERHRKFPLDRTVTRFQDRDIGSQAALIP
jgi:hypothetical protein